MARLRSWAQVSSPSRKQIECHADSRNFDSYGVWGFCLLELIPLPRRSKGLTDFYKPWHLLLRPFFVLKQMTTGGPLLPSLASRGCTSYFRLQCSPVYFQFVGTFCLASSNILTRASAGIALHTQLVSQHSHCHNKTKCQTFFHVNHCCPPLHSSTIRCVQKPPVGLPGKGGPVHVVADVAMLMEPEQQQHCVNKPLCGFHLKQSLANMRDSPLSTVVRSYRMELNKDRTGSMSFPSKHNQEKLALYTKTGNMGNPAQMQMPSFAHVA